MEQVTYCERMRAVREMARLSQEELSELSGVPRTSISRYERGETTPSLSNMIDIAKVLRLTLGQLVGTEPLPKGWVLQWEERHYE